MIHELYIYIFTHNKLLEWIFKKIKTIKTYKLFNHKRNIFQKIIF